DAYAPLAIQTVSDAALHRPFPSARPFDGQRLLVENFIPIQSIIFRKSLFDHFGGFNPDFDHLEDWNLWVRYAQVGDFMYTPKVTSIYLTPNDPDIRQKRHLQLHAAYETVRDKNLEDVAKLQAKLSADKGHLSISSQRWT
ncbi:MAG: hypothetical protein AAFP97_12620, partial [Pseudomonadota bacterium]